MEYNPNETLFEMKKKLCKYLVVPHENFYFLFKGKYLDDNDKGKMTLSEIGIKDSNELCLIQRLRGC
jgi:hypothetical protein